MIRYLTYFIFGFIPVLSCHHKQPLPVFGNFPPEVGAIFSRSCAIAGCHNEKSKMAAGSLSLSSWEQMFYNGGSNSVAVPYSPGQSPIFFFANTFADLGPVNSPTMPVGSKPLCREEVLIIRNWLRNGAPSALGKIMYADPTGADAPHHYTECKSINGYVTKINLLTMEVVNDSKAVVNVNPVSIAFR